MSTDNHDDLNQLEPDPSEITSLPADVAIQYLYTSNGLYTYAAECCKVVTHTGLLMSSTYIEEEDLGCPLTGGPGTQIPGEEMDPPTGFMSTTKAVQIAVGPFHPKGIIIRSPFVRPETLEVPADTDKIIKFDYDALDHRPKSRREKYSTNILKLNTIS